MLSAVELGHLPEDSGLEREVIIMMTDMVGYSHVTAHMRPNEIRDFMVAYHNRIRDIVCAGGSATARIEPLAGDGSLIIFEKTAAESKSALCRRAVAAAVRLAQSVSRGKLPSTRLGLHYGEIIEAQLHDKIVHFGASFAVAARLEELCDYFGTPLLMDREIASSCSGDDEEVVCVGKVMLDSFARPLRIYSVYKPGIDPIPEQVDQGLFADFVDLRKQAMQYFCGDASAGLAADFPRAQQVLAQAQRLHIEMAGCVDRPTERILEYIRETPSPGRDFFSSGMRLSKKGRESLGATLLHLSEGLLKAMDQELYHALVIDTTWEKYFRLEWRKMGEDIITINAKPDGVYFIDSGEVVTLNEFDEPIATLSAGTIFGEMAYFSRQKRRTATVRASTDVVLRKISSEDFAKLPVIVKIFERIAMARR